MMYNSHTKLETSKEFLVFSMTCFKSWRHRRVIKTFVVHQSTLSCLLLQGVKFDQGGGCTGKRVVIVMFIGGVTFAEMAALRYISQQPAVNAEFVIATTKIINGSSLVVSCMDAPVAESLSSSQAWHASGSQFRVYYTIPGLCTNSNWGQSWDVDFSFVPGEYFHSNCPTFKFDFTWSTTATQHSIVDR